MIPDMPMIPDRLKKFKLWKDKYPIFFTVMMEDGKPNFRVVSREKQIECANRNLCHICGERMQPPYYFIGGPGSISSHLFADGPMHRECAEYSAKACPFLANPNAIYSIKPVTKHENIEYIINHQIDAGSPRPAKMGIGSTMEYHSELACQYPNFIAGVWIAVDWETIKPLEE